MPARPGVHPHLHADVGRAGDVAGLGGLGVLAEVVVRDVRKPGSRRVGRRLPVLGGGRCGTYLARDPADLLLLLGIVDQPAGLEVDARGRGDMSVGPGVEDLAGKADHQVDIAVALGMDERPARLPLPLQIDQDALVDAVVVVEVVRAPLIEPDRLARVRVAREDAGGPLVVAGRCSGFQGPGLAVPW